MKEIKRLAIIAYDTNEVLKAIGTINIGGETDEVKREVAVKYAIARAEALDAGKNLEQVINSPFWTAAKTDAKPLEPTPPLVQKKPTLVTNTEKK
jgi:hypothetical protein